MTVGYPKTADVLNSRLGYLVATQKQLIDAYNRLKADVDGFDDATLMAAPFGYSQAEVTNIRQLVTDLYNGGRVLTGQQAQASANNFLFWAEQLHVTAFD